MGLSRCSRSPLTKTRFVIAIVSRGNLDAITWRSLKVHLLTVNLAVISVIYNYLHLKSTGVALIGLVAKISSDAIRSKLVFTPRCRQLSSTLPRVENDIVRAFKMNDLDKTPLLQ